MEVARAVAPVVACPGPAVALTTPVLPAQPPAAPAQAAPIKSWVPDVPLAELLLEQRDEEMSDRPLDQDEMVLLDAMNSGARMHTSVSRTASPSNWGLAMSAMGPGMQGLSRLSRGHKPPLKVDNMEIVDFPAGVPVRADAAQLLFMLPITVPVPATQFKVVVVATDPCTLAQYDGLMAEAAKTLAISKGKTKAIPTEEDSSDYGQSSKEEEEEEEEGETPAQRFQCIQQNKKLAKKKANRAEAAAALARRAQNDFSGGPPNVEQLNSFFHGALGPSFYYSYRTNMVLVGADANRAAAYEFSFGNVADTLRTMVYKFACRGFTCTPYELEWLFRYCVNLNVPRCNCIVAFMLISELRLVAQHLDTALQDRTMQILLQDPSYRDLPNLIQGLEDMAIVE
ncbi:hypothetical protein H2248_011485 [Termitomyces sp. 'cryptogamus']|nr:hypothetical protein H2248_011485 [Termitomyces sp. 'cryptogamus']